MPRSCTICAHPEVDSLNKSICNNVSYRNVALRANTTATTVMRHIEGCLKLEMSALRKENRVEQAINVHEEFREQLAFAKDLRVAAREYLSDVNDPLRLSITPKAHEIEVTYFDHNDMEMVGEVMRPKKKTAQLSVILESIFTEGNLEPDKFKITSIDIRKFALDAINTTDTCIDKFAKLSGEYTKDKENPQTVGDLATAVAEKRAMMEYMAEIHEYTKGVYGAPFDETQLTEWMDRACAKLSVPKSKLVDAVQQLGAVD